jgi:hypothetical protein
MPPSKALLQGKLESGGKSEAWNCRHVVAFLKIVPQGLPPLVSHLLVFQTLAVQSLARRIRATRKVLLEVQGMVDVTPFTRPRSTFRGSEAPCAYSHAVPVVSTFRFLFRVSGMVSNVIVLTTISRIKYQVNRSGL